MKSLFKKVSLISIFIFLFSANIFAEEKVDSDKDIESELEAGIPDEMDDLDDLFSNTEDTTEPIITEPEPQNETIPENRKGIVFSGNLNARLGGEIYYPIKESQPGAVFESKISFTARPIDNFSIKGTLLVKFPEMELGLYELYMNYNFWDFAYVMAGKKELVWGNGRIFDTNILDDEANYEYKPEDLLLNKVTKMANSKFAVEIDVPFWKFNFTGLAYYETFGKKVEDLDPETNWGNICYAAKLEANLRNFALDIFWKTWADNDINRYPQAVGADINFQLGDLHFYTQYFTHLMQINGKIQNPRSKGTASVWWATRDKVNLGFILEYQIVYDWYGLGTTPDDENWDSSKYIKQYIAFQGVWGRIGGSKLTAAIKCFHDFYEKYGTIVPGLKIHDIVPNADLDFGLPIYYGSKNKVGLGFQITLKVEY